MSDAEAAYKGLENYQTQQIELQTQMLLVKSLKEYVDNPANYMEIIPANLGLTDESLNSMIAGYNAKVVERKRLLTTAPESSPVVVSITNAISSLYPGIRHSLSTVYDNMRVQKRHVDEQYDLFIGRLSDAPAGTCAYRYWPSAVCKGGTLSDIVAEARGERHFFGLHGGQGAGYRRAGKYYPSYFSEKETGGAYRFGDRDSHSGRTDILAELVALSHRRT